MCFSILSAVRDDGAWQLIEVNVNYPGSLIDVSLGWDGSRIGLVAEQSSDDVFDDALLVHVSATPVAYDHDVVGVFWLLAPAVRPYLGQLLAWEAIKLTPVQGVKR